MNRVLLGEPWQLQKQQGLASMADKTIGPLTKRSSNTVRRLLSSAVNNDKVLVQKCMYVMYRLMYY